MAPAFETKFATSLDTAGSMVLLSIINESGCTPLLNKKNRGVQPDSLMIDSTPLLNKKNRNLYYPDCWKSELLYLRDY